MDTTTLKVTNDLQKIDQAAAESIEFPNHEYIASSKHGYTLFKLGTVGGSATDALLKDQLAAGLE
ncbi:MAG TPA: hypothetical protein VN934_05775 [Candidatus Tumulicola sp.]|nr:hypothetical protein [Candidatus Tumulicola sp.]